MGRPWEVMENLNAPPPHRSLNKSAYQRSVSDWLNTPIHLIGPADMRQLLIGSSCDLPATAVDSCLIGWL